MDSPASIHEGAAGIDLDILIAQFGLDKVDAEEPESEPGPAPVPTPALSPSVHLASKPGTEPLLILGYGLISGEFGPADIGAQTMKRNVKLIASMDTYDTILKLIESVGTAKTIRIVSAVQHGKNMLTDAIDKLVSYSASLLACTRTRQAYMRNNCTREADNARDQFIQAKQRYKQVMLEGPEEDAAKVKFQGSVRTWKTGIRQVLERLTLPGSGTAPRLTALINAVRTSIGLQLSWEPDADLDLDRLIASFSAHVAELSEKLGLVLEMLNGGVSTAAPGPDAVRFESPLEHSIAALHKAQGEYTNFVQKSTREGQLLDADKLKALTDTVKQLQEQYETQLALQSKDLMSRQKSMAGAYLTRHPRLGQLLARLLKSSESMTQSMDKMRHQLVARRERYEESVRLAGEHLADRCREADSRCGQVLRTERATARKNLDHVYSCWLDLLRFTCGKLDQLVQDERKTTATIWNDMSKNLATTMEQLFSEDARKRCYEAWQKEIK